MQVEVEESKEERRKEEESKEERREVAVRGEVREIIEGEGIKLEVISSGIYLNIALDGVGGSKIIKEAVDNVNLDRYRISIYF